MLKLFLGGAALQRCGNCIIVNEALAAEVTSFLIPYAALHTLARPLHPASHLARRLHRLPANPLRPRRPRPTNARRRRRRRRHPGRAPRLRTRRPARRAVPELLERRTARRSRQVAAL